MADFDASDPAPCPSTSTPHPLSLTAPELAAARAADYPPDPIPSVIPGGGISLLAGSSGTGKTAFLAWLVTRFRDRLPIFGHLPAIVPYQAVLAVDRSWIQSTSRWFEAVGYPEIPAYSPLDDPRFKPYEFRNKRQRIALLGRFLDQIGPLPPNSLVYVDPIAPFLGGNLIDYDACGIACMEIRELCRDRRVTIIGTAHTAKLKADPKDRYARKQDRILGSAALLGYTDTQMYLASPEESDSEYYSFFWNPHHAAPGLFDLSRDPNTGLFVPPDPTAAPPVAEEAPVDPSPAPRAPELDHLLTLLTQLTPDDHPELGVPYSLIVQAAGYPDATVHRHLQALVKGGEVVQPKRGRYRRGSVS